MLGLNTQKTIKTQKPLSKKERVTVALVIVIIIGLLIAALVYRKDIAAIGDFSRYSLIGVLVISIVACSPLSVTAIPIPYLLVIFTLPGILAETWGLLAPVWVGITGAVGATMGQTPTFLIGYSSRDISEKFLSRISKRAYDKAFTWINKYGSAVVFAVSAIPNPVHLPVTVALGAAKFSPRSWVVLSLAGNLAKCMIIAFAGYFGLDIVLRLIGH